jgi:conjugative transfer region protein (TIGR03750 family)
MDEHDFTDQFVPTFVNSEPEVLSGLTEFELVACVSVGAVVGLALGILLGLFWLGIWGVFVFITAWIGVAWLLSRIIKAVKRGKPKGYMSASLKVWLVRFTGRLFNKESMYLQDVPLGIGRTYQGIIVVIDSDGANDEERN